MDQESLDVTKNWLTKKPEEVAENSGRQPTRQYRVPSMGQLLGTCVNTYLLPLPSMLKLIFVSPTNLKLLVRNTVCGEAQPEWQRKKGIYKSMKTF